MASNKTASLIPTWSLVGLVGLCSIFGLFSGGLAHATADILTFLSGNNMDLPVGGTIEVFIPELFGFLTVSFAATLLIYLGLAPLFRQVKDHAVVTLLAKMAAGFHTGTFLLWAAAEEVLFRWLFLDVIAKGFHATTGAPFYFIVALSVIIFGLVHVTNFNSGLPSPLLLLPQMLLGIILVIVFLQWGLLGSTFVHFCFNATLLSTAKKQEFNWVDVGLILWSGLVAAISYFCIRGDIQPFLLWIRSDMNGSIPGWGLWQYFGMIMLIGSLTSLVLDLLLLDQTEPTGLIEWMQKHGATSTFLVAFFVIALTPLLIISFWWLSGIFFGTPGFRILACAVGITAINTTSSGSAIARNVYQSIPDSVVAILALNALGFWGFLALLLITTIINLPGIILKELNT
jgi:hypothetical protein